MANIRACRCKGDGLIGSEMQTQEGSWEEAAGERDKTDKRELLLGKHVPF